MDGASPVVEEVPPNPDVTDAPSGYEQGFEKSLLKMYCKT